MSSSSTGGLTPQTSTVHKSASLITVVNCGISPAQICAQWVEGSETHQVPLHVTASASLIESGLLGEHVVAGEKQNLAYVYYMISASESQLSVVSLKLRKTIASARTPAGNPVWGTDMGILQGPQSSRYPFISAGYISKINSETWVKWCRFDSSLVNLSSAPTASANGCGSGFKEFNLFFQTTAGVPASTASATKHSGFWLSDVDGDGWEDVTFPFFQGYLLTVSGSAGHQLGLSHFDVAAGEGNYAPHYFANQTPFFHGGRFYGGFFDVPTSPVPMKVVVAGDVVGRFDDGDWCNVSRYVAGVQWSTGFNLAWVKYVGWGRSLFNDDGSVVRPGNEVGKCIHRISDAVHVENSQSLVIYNQFDVIDPATMCDRVALNYQGNVANEQAAQQYSACLRGASANKPGAWSINILNAQTGQGVSTLANHYVWGRVEKIWPEFKKPLYLLHSYASGTNFAQSGQGLKDLVLAQIDGQQFSSISILSCPSAVPKLREGTLGGNMYGTYPKGKTISTPNVGLKDIVVKDIDGDGLNEIALADGRWVGYKDGQLRYKDGAAPACQKKMKIRWSSNGLFACGIDNGAAIVSGNNNGDRSGAWPQAPMSGGFLTADLSQNPSVNFSCLSPNGWSTSVTDFKINFNLQSQMLFGNWASQGARACGIDNGSIVLGGTSGGGEALSGTFSMSDTRQGAVVNMNCASEWGWNNGINDRSLTIEFTPQ